MVEVKKTRGTYLLSELDRTIMDSVFPGERLKRFFLRRGVAVGVDEDEAGGGIAEEDDEEVAGDDGKVDEMEE